MIRREVVAGAALASACFLTGQLWTPPVAPVIEHVAPQLPASLALTVVAPIEAHPGMFMTWPQKPSRTPELQVGLGCDVWSETYEVRSIDHVHTEIHPIDPDDVTDDNRISMAHASGAEVSFYPVTHEKSWVVVVDRTAGDGTLMRFDKGRVQCGAAFQVGPTADVRADAAVANGVHLYSLDDETFRGAVYDDDCELLSSRELRPGVVTPNPVVWRSAPGQTLDGTVPLLRHAVQGTRLKLTHGQRYSGQSVMLEAELDIQKFMISHEGDGIVVAFFDQGSTYVHLLDADLNEIWSQRLTNQQLWQDPITGVSYIDGVLALRGGLDASPWNGGNEWIRIWDTHADELIGEISPEVVHEVVEELTWTWPKQTEQPLESCLGGGGLFGGCDGEVATMSWSLRRMRHLQLEVEINREQGGCSNMVTLNSETDLRVSRSPDHAFTVYGMSDERLVGWTFGLDCEVKQHVDLPRSLLDSHPTEDVAVLPPLCGFGPRGSSEVDLNECERGVTTRGSAIEDELVVATWNNRTLKLYLLAGLAGPRVDIDVPLNQPLDDVVTALAWDGEYLTARGALESSPWSADRDGIRVYRGSTGEVVVNVPAAAVESN